MSIRGGLTGRKKPTCKCGPEVKQESAVLSPWAAQIQPSPLEGTLPSDSSSLLLLISSSFIPLCAAITCTQTDNLSVIYSNANTPCKPTGIQRSQWRIHVWTNRNKEKQLRGRGGVLWKNNANVCRRYERNVNPTSKQTQKWSTLGLRSMLQQDVWSVGFVGTFQRPELRVSICWLVE